MKVTVVARMFTGRSSALGACGNAGNSRPQRIESLVNPLISSFDLLGVVDVRGSISSQRSDEHSHSSADVGAFQTCGAQLGRAGHNGAMRDTARFRLP